MPPKTKDIKNPLAGNPLLKAFEKQYGAGVIPADILAIWPDLRQPRRVIPLSIRGQWDGDPIELAGVLADWHLIVEERLHQMIPLELVLTGKADDALSELKASDDPIVLAYFALLDLAMTIYLDGQKNPISIVNVGDHWMIEDGERRWLACHLLYIQVSVDFRHIPAFEKDKLDVWAQAAENGARQPLNAIGMARQIALLIMDMYETGKDQPFDDMEKLVLPGEPDRKYYAQVANGNVYRIPKGMIGRVLSVTGLKTPESVRKYRGLLDIPDALWIKADEQNWTEWQIREYVDAAEKSRNQNMTQLDTVPYGTVSGDQGGASEGETPNHSRESDFKDGDLVVTKSQGYVVKLYRANERSFVDMLHGKSARGVGFSLDASNVIFIDLEAFPITPELTPEQHEAVRILLSEAPVGQMLKVGDWVRTKGNDARKISEIVGNTAWFEGFPASKHEILDTLTKIVGVEKTPSTNPRDLTTKERSELFEAYAVLSHPGAFEQTHGWYAVNQPTFTGDEITGHLSRNTETLEALLELGYLEKKQLTLEPRWGERECVRITAAGCAAIGDPWIDLDKPREDTPAFKINDRVRVKGNPAVGTIKAVATEQVMIEWPNPKAPGTFISSWAMRWRVSKATDEQTASGGLYDQPAATPPAQRYDEDEDWSDDDEEDEESEELGDEPHGTSGKTGLPVATTPVRETTVAILAAWENPETERILKFLRTLAGENAALKRGIDELLHLSRADIERMSNSQFATLNFEGWMRNEDKHLHTLIYERLERAVSEFLNHLYDVNEAIKAKERE